jgi:hypothetical protein
MDNQHQHIKGYRDLSAEEIALMNEGKALSEQVGAFTEKLMALPAVHADHGGAPTTPVSIDKRWASIGVTHLQQGFMAVIRSIARPTTF